MKKLIRIKKENIKINIPRSKDILTFDIVIWYDWKLEKIESTVIENIDLLQRKPMVSISKKDNLILVDYT